MARANRCAILSSISDDLASLACIIFSALIDGQRAPLDLDRGSASVCGTILVETPFMVHLAGTSEWQRLAIIGLGLGIIIASAAVLRLRRKTLPPTRACLLALNTAYIANLSLCLLVYSEATGSVRSRFGWFAMMVMVWPMIVELVWIFIQAFRTSPLFRNVTL